MPTNSSIFRGPVRRAKAAWVRFVVAGAVAVVAATVLTVSLLATGDGSADKVDPVANDSSAAEPRGEGGVAEQPGESAKPSKSKKKNDKGDKGSSDEKPDGDDDSDGGGGGDTSSYPGSGTYRITVDGYCLGVGPEPGNESREVFVFDSCGSASPPTKLVKSGSRTYQVTVYSSGNGTGCMQVDSPGDGSGLLAGPTGCTGSGLQSFKLKQVGGGYRMTVAATGVCVGPLSGGASAGEALATRGCGTVFGIAG